MPAYLEDLSEYLIIPKALLLDKKYFPGMLTKHDRRSMDLYLLLLAHSQLTGKTEFSIDLEDMALSLDMPGLLSNSRLRDEVIKSLRQLRGKYSLIKGRFYYGRDAIVTLLPVLGDSFKAPIDLLIQIHDPELKIRLKFIFMMEALLKDEGKDLHSLPHAVLAEKFNINRKTIERGLKDLHLYTKTKNKR